MDIEVLDDGNYKYLLTFHNDEVEAVGAAFREHIYNLAVKGNTGSISSYEQDIARNWVNGGSRGLYINNAEENVISVLEQFHEGTDESIMRIPETSGIPAFLSPNIADRKYLGEVALALAKEIKEKTVVAEFQGELDAVMPEDFGTTN